MKTKYIDLDTFICNIHSYSNSKRIDICLNLLEHDLGHKIEDKMLNEFKELECNTNIDKIIEIYNENIEIYKYAQWYHPIIVGNLLYSIIALSIKYKEDR